MTYLIAGLMVAFLIYGINIAFECVGLEDKITMAELMAKDAALDVVAELECGRRRGCGVSSDDVVSWQHRAAYYGATAEELTDALEFGKVLAEELGDKDV